MEKAIVEVKQLSHRYGGSQWAIRDITFEINQKGILGLLGSNGAGKSTTMNIICGVLNQTEGEVYINGIDLKKHPVEAKRHIGFLPQKPPLQFDLTVDEYLHYCAHLRQIAPNQVKTQVEIAKEKCGVAHFSRRLLRNLSGGYQQRVGIAQAIVHNPTFVVFDEPTNGLDPNQIIEVRKLIKEIAQDRAVLLSTHILSEVQLTCDEIKMIDHGQMVFSGTMEAFNNCIEPDSLVVQLKNPPPVEELQAIADIIRVTALTRTQFRLHFASITSEEVAEKVVSQSVQHGWGLYEIHIEKGSLDEVFARLSQKQ